MDSGDMNITGKGRLELFQGHIWPLSHQLIEPGHLFFTKGERAVPTGFWRGLPRFAQENPTANSSLTNSKHFGHGLGVLASPARSQGALPDFC